MRKKARKNDESTDSIQRDVYSIDIFTLCLFLISENWNGFQMLRTQAHTHARFVLLSISSSIHLFGMNAVDDEKKNEFIYFFIRSSSSMSFAQILRAISLCNIIAMRRGPSKFRFYRFKRFLLLQGIHSKICVQSINCDADCLLNVVAFDERFCFFSVCFVFSLTPIHLSLSIFLYFLLLLLLLNIHNKCIITPPEKVNISLRFSLRLPFIFTFSFRPCSLYYYSTCHRALRAQCALVIFSLAFAKFAFCFGRLCLK